MIIFWVYSLNGFPIIFLIAWRCNPRMGIKFLLISSLRKIVVTWPLAQVLHIYLFSFPRFKTLSLERFWLSPNFQNFRYSSKFFAEICGARYQNATSVYICDTPIWRTQNSINIWNLLWLSMWLIIRTEQTLKNLHAYFS